MHLKKIIPAFLLVIVSILILVFFVRFYGVYYLTFSDGAKFADIARNIISGFGYNGNFSFWGSKILDLSEKTVFPSPWIPPLMPFSIAGAFKLFSVSDFSVIVTSSMYFVLLILFTYLLGNKLLGKLVGLISALSVLTNESLVRYAISGATEPLFMFEIVTTAYLLTLKKKWAIVLGFIFMILMYFTRPQAFIYIAGLVLYWLLISFKPQKAFLSFVMILIGGLLIDKFILGQLAGRYFLYPILARGTHALSQITAVSSPSDALRGVVQSASFLSSFKKIFYNLYNLYKLLPQIASPYLWSLFLIGLFHWSKNKIYNAFKISAIFMIALTFLVTAFSIPLFRYVHPAVPFVYLIAVETVVWIVRIMINDWLLVVGEKLKTQITNHKSLIIALLSVSLIFVFVVGQTLGVIFLDSRFNSRLVNKDKPPVYVILSRILKDNTDSSQLILTNLDTWGSWYGERRTVWYPLSPDMIIPNKNQINSIGAIYLTSYLIDDENYYMGDGWRQILSNPYSIKNTYIASNYKLRGVFEIKSADNYEKSNYKAVLLVRKNK